MSSWADVPLPKTPLGEALYARGRALVEAGVRLETIAWDADEVLWDWVMSVSQTAQHIPGYARSRDLSHREYMRLKPGVWELLWGMHHALIAAGEDPYLRVWTAGYYWRLWRIAKDVPGLPTLLGPPAELQGGPQAWTTHPNIMCREDTLGALVTMLGRDRRDWLGTIDPRVRRTLLNGLMKPRGQAGLKIPELAMLRGRRGFDRIRLLVDDAPKNARAFAASGRTAVRIDDPAPKLWGRIPNTVWSDPHVKLAAQRGDIASPLADALLRAHELDYPARLIPVRPTGQEYYATLSFTMDIPGQVIEEQWVAPMNALREALHGGALKDLLKL